MSSRRPPYGPRLPRFPLCDPENLLLVSSVKFYSFSYYFSLRRSSLLCYFDCRLGSLWACTSFQRTSQAGPAEGRDTGGSDETVGVNLGRRRWRKDVEATSVPAPVFFTSATFSVLFRFFHRRLGAHSGLPSGVGVVPEMVRSGTCDFTSRVWSVWVEPKLRFVHGLDCRHSEIVWFPIKVKF